MEGHPTGKEMLMKKLWIIAVLLSAIGCFNANEPDPAEKNTITLSAGMDTTVPKNASIYLVGSIIHSDFPDSQLVSVWKQLAGPGPASIADTSSLISQVTFPATGLFSFMLKVSTGTCHATDTVHLTITDSIPFKILSPGPNERVTIGGSCLIRWQVVTPTKMIIFLTCDKGKTYTSLTTLALNLNDTSWLWQVDPSLPPADSCKVRVADYFNRSFYTESEKYFSLVP
jgi:hypothetical protein